MHRSMSRMALALATVFCSALPLAAQVHPHPVPAANAAQAPSAPVSQGIHISGWWKIEVRNPDGTLVRHVEFENALENSGKTLLVNLIMGNSSGGGLLVSLSSDSPENGPCTNLSGNAASCLLIPTVLNSVYGCSPPTCSNNLTTTVGTASITLFGYMPASRNGNITNVATLLNGCGATTTPQTCASGKGDFGASHLTSQQLAAPIPVTVNQVVSVTVVLSFS